MSSVLRSRIQNDLKSAMRAREALRVSTLRMMIARLKDIDIAARPKAVAEADIVVMLRGMVKARREAATLYRHGSRPDLADKETAEIGIIEEYLPDALSGAELDAAIGEAIGATGAAAPKDLGKVLAALKAAHGPALDMVVAASAAKAKLAKP